MFFNRLKKDIFDAEKLKLLKSLDPPGAHSNSDDDENTANKAKGRGNKKAELNFNNLHNLNAKERNRLKLREYVDMKQDNDLGLAVKDLLYKLKDLYFIRKTKPQKGKFKKA